jgi:CRP/FNR family cyclic AMP-dependent transcriptional regulator
VTVRVLDVDPELGELLEPSSFALARRAALARVVALEPGPWCPPSEPPDPTRRLGLLVIDGLLEREARIAGVACDELLARGDVLRPWDDDATGAPVPVESGWQVLSPTRLALLDRSFVAAIAPWPELAVAIAGRLSRRSGRLSCLLAISHLTRTDARVLALLWHLADGHGRVTAQGVIVPLDLTHEMLGRLVGARRQSVTTALGELSRRGLVSRLDDRTWLLSGDPELQLARLAMPSASDVPDVSEVAIA